MKMARILPVNIYLTIKILSVKYLTQPEAVGPLFKWRWRATHRLETTVFVGV